MFKNQFRLGKAFGIPLRIDASWLLIFVWVTWSLARGYFPNQYPAWSTAVTWALAILTSLLFFGSVLLHELGHALVARANGTPVHDITLFIFGGVAEISDEPETPGKELIMAASGPLVSLGLSAFFAILYLLTRRAVEPLAALGFYLGVINLNLGVFNLIPGFPLDGGRVLRAILWSARRDLLWATRWASRAGQLIAYLFIIGGIVLAFSGNWVSGIWLAFIGLFLDNAARSAYQQLTLRQVLNGHIAEEIMSRDCFMLPPQVTLDVLVDQHLLGGAQRCLTVGVDDDVQGLISVHNVRKVPKEEWPFTRVGDVLTPLAQLQTVSPDTALWEVLQKMTADGVNQLPVVYHGSLVGMVTRENLVTFIRDQAAWGLS